MFGVTSTEVLKEGGPCGSPHDKEANDVTAWALVKETQKSQTYRCNWLGGCGRIETDHFGRT